MRDMVPTEIERYISERILPGRIGIIRATGPVANDDVYEYPRDQRDRAGRNHRERSRRRIESLPRRIGRVGCIGKRICNSIRRARAKRRNYQVLSSMNQSMLWDIGIGPRANIPSVVEAVYSQSERNRDGSPENHHVVDVGRQEAANELNRQPVA